jgi:hypothetical protein
MFETMTRTEELQSIFWDLYKEAHGFRPRHVDTTGWTEEQFNVEFNELSTIAELNCRQRQADEETAAHKFEMRVQSVIACGAKDREMALRWIHEAEGSNGDNEYLCYLVGLPYRYFAKVAV